MGESGRVQGYILSKEHNERDGYDNGHDGSHKAVEKKWQSLDLHRIKKRR